MSWSPRRSRVGVVALAIALASGALKWWVVETALQPSPAPQAGAAPSAPAAPAAPAASAGASTLGRGPAPAR